MPKAPNHLALARQWEILKKIPARSARGTTGITASELTVWLRDQGYPVSKRTVERDLLALESQFGLACNDNSAPYGWYWLDGKQHEFGGIELMDAVSLTIAENILKQMLPSPMLAALAPKFEQAKNKLDTLATELPYARWTNKVHYLPTTMATIPPTVAPEILDAVQAALLEELQIDVSYATFNSAKNKQLTLHPLAIIQKGNTPYLVASAFEYEDVRLYAVHRIRQITVLAQKICPPTNFDLDQYLASGAMEFGSGETITLKAIIGNELAMYLTETPLCPKQKITSKDGEWLLTANLRDSWQLYLWILSQGSQITVVSPAPLRKIIRDELQAAHAGYLDKASI